MCSCNDVVCSWLGAVCKFMQFINCIVHSMDSLRFRVRVRLMARFRVRVRLMARFRVRVRLMARFRVRVSAVQFTDLQNAQCNL